MNKTIKNLNYSKSKNRSKKLLKGGYPTMVNDEEKAQSAPAILKLSEITEKKVPLKYHRLKTLNKMKKKRKKKAEKLQE